MTPLRPYQMEGALAVRSFNGRALIADEMGLGKSLQALFYSYKMRRARPIIILCPASLKWNWEDEARRHLGMRCEILNGQRPHGNRFQGITCPIYIINYQILKYWRRFLVSLNPQILIVDECHNLKNQDSQWYRHAQGLCDEAQIPYRIALSGTPLTNRPAELWSVLHLLRPDKFPHFPIFANTYCDPVFRRGKWEFKGAKHMRYLHRYLKSFVMIRRVKKDVLPDLPDKLRKAIPLQLSAEARKEYEYARQHFIAWLRVAISHAAADRAKKAQAVTIVGYLLRLLAKLKRHETLEWIQNFLEESDEKIVIFSGHTKLIEWLCKRFPGIHVRVDGHVTGLHRHHAVQRFQNDRTCRLAICNPVAAGVGLNMTAASHVLYCDFPWTPGTLKQGEDRIHRIGQSKQCFIWYLVALNTIEDRLMELLTKKQEILDQLLDGKKRGNDFDLFRELLYGGELKRTE